MWTWEVNRRTLHAFLAWNEIDCCRSQEAQLTLNTMSRGNVNEMFPFKSINRLISNLKSLCKNDGITRIDSLENSSYK